MRGKSVKNFGFKTLFLFLLFISTEDSALNFEAITCTLQHQNKVLNFNEGIKINFKLAF